MVKGWWGWMDPVSLSVGAVVAAVVAKATDKGAGALVDAGAAAVGRLVGWLRSRLTGEDRAVLERVEEVPDSPSRQQELARVVDARVGADGDFARELEEMVERVQETGAHVVAVNQSAWGNQNVQVANSSDVHVTYASPPPPAPDSGAGSGSSGP